MKDAAAAKIADKMFQVDWDGRPLHDRAASARIIRSAIRRAVKAERERCVKCVKTVRNSTKIGEFVCDNIIDAIQAKRPSRKRK
jgi:uncharacterized protein (UPF0261 family)